MGKNYTYEAARVRVLESRLLTEEDYRRLAQGRSEEEMVQWVRSRGMGDAHARRMREVLGLEEEKLQALAEELLGEGLVYRVFCLPEAYEQLKLELKQKYRSLTERKVSGFVTESMQKQCHFWSRDMEDASMAAMTVLLQTGSAQQFDMILDKASLQEQQKAARESRIAALNRYAEHRVMTANLRIALRSAAMGKSVSFIQDGLVPSERIQVSVLAEWACRGKEPLLTYLREQGWREAADAWSVSSGAFEQWCESYEMAGLQQAKGWEPFAVVLKYLLRKKEEIRKMRSIAVRNMLKEAEGEKEWNRKGRN